MALYTIWVATGDDELAGTDSNVFIRLAGTKAVTETLHLPPQDIFAFESGSVDKFVLEIPDLGELKECCIGHDNSEGDSGWYIKTVQIQNDETNQQWLFTFEQWLGVEESGVLSACVEA
jgi:hypothetical protein